MSLPNPVIVIPGITASGLRDEYEVAPEILWSAVRSKDYGRLTLHPDDLRYELEEPARIGVDEILKTAYGHLIHELRHNLTENRDKPVPVYPFPYDWRHPLDLIEEQLESFVQEVIARTKLMKHYHKDGYAEDPEVDLVGHSMGGLIIAGYLQRLGEKAAVGKVATLGTPFRGSFEAPIKVITGTSSLDGDVRAVSADRVAARLTPALYHLIPSFEDAIETPSSLPNDLYSVDTWQEGVIKTLAEFIRLHGLRGGNVTKRKNQAKELLGGILQRAKGHRGRVENLKLGQAGLEQDAWLCLVGVDSKTRVRLKIEKKGGKPFFNLTGDHRLNDWEHSDPQRRIFTGDGTVPYLGAEASFIGRENLVCLRPDDFGYWEIADKVLLRAAGFHAILPRLNLAQRLIISHLRGEPTKGVWGRPAPGISDSEWSPPIKNLKNKE
ncbi:MAG: lipase/acyltransferase domain-containing protein [Candidatus Hydrogenedentota bacterium]